MKLFIRNNALFFLFIASQIVVAILGVQDDKIIGEFRSFKSALFLHFLGLILFTVGYLPLSKSTFLPLKIEKKQITINPAFYKISYVVTVVGVVTSIVTIGTFIPPKQYLEILFTGGKGLGDLRAEANSSGLSGFFKMMNYFPLGIFLISNAYSVFYKMHDSELKKINNLSLFSLLASIVKVFFVMDRLTILAIILVYSYKFILDGKIKTKFLIYMFLVIPILSFVTSSRMDGFGVFDFLVTYFKLSLANFELVIDNQENFSYGFNSFLMPFIFILRFFGVTYEVIEPEKWVWNPAQYFASYLYIDFGFFSVLFFFFIGWLVRVIQVKALKGNLKFVAVYFIILFGITTFISVPIIRAVEFWLLISLGLFLSKYVKLVE